MNEQLERLINRALDGELGDDARLELDRELIRNPEARRIFAEYQAMDQSAVAGLDRAFGGESKAPAWAGEELAPKQTVPLARRHMSVRWLIPGAIAAALLATVVPYPDLRSPAPTAKRVVTAPTESPLLGRTAQGVLPRTVSSSAGATPAVHRNRGRDLIGVLGDDGNVYWIEVERTRTVTLPHGTGSRSQPMNDF